MMMPTLQDYCEEYRKMKELSCDSGSYLILNKWQQIYGNLVRAGSSWFWGVLKKSFIYT